MQSAEDRRACSFQQQVSDLEALVSVACAKGVEPARCREIISDTVKRARWKGSLLPHLDSQLLLSTLEQVKSEIAGLSEVTATNAQLMEEELLHHQERAEEQAAAESEDVGVASVLSLPGGSSFAPADSGRLPPGLFAAAGRAARPPSEASSAHSGSVASPVAPRTAPARAHSLSAAEAVAPMRDFASEVAATSATEADEERTFRHSVSMRPSKSGDLRTAASYDFETAMSPRAGYHVRDDPFSFSPSDRLGLGSVDGLLSLERSALGEEGKQEGVEGAAEEAEEEREGMEGATEEEEEEEKQEGAEEAADEGEEEEEEEEEGDVLVMYSRPSPQPAEGPPRGVGPPAGPRAAPAMPAIRPGGSSCCADIPPGFNPSAIVEGSATIPEDYECIDPHSPTGMGTVDLLSYSSAPFALHSVTPPRHVMEELAASVQGQLQLR